MKAYKITLLLALIPTFLFSFDTSYDDLRGYWLDDYRDTRLEIQQTRTGIRVIERGGLFPKWRRYDYVGRGVFDDYNGRIIIKRGYNQIEYRRGRRGSIALYRDGYRPRSYGNGYSGYSRDYRNPSVRSYGRSRGIDRYFGRWYDRGRGINLRIEAYGQGFRARYGNTWTYYTPYRDYYRDQRGNRYYFDDDYLCWDSYDGRRRLRFRR